MQIPPPVQGLAKPPSHSRWHADSLQPSSHVHEPSSPHTPCPEQMLLAPPRHSVSHPVCVCVCVCVCVYGQPRAPTMETAVCIPMNAYTHLHVYTHTHTHTHIPAAPPRVHIRRKPKLTVTRRVCQTLSMSATRGRVERQDIAWAAHVAGLAAVPAVAHARTQWTREF